MPRLDAELVARGIARSRERAKEMIKSGAVTVNGKTAKKPSDEVCPGDAITSSEQELYVGRGALKLEKAYEEFSLDFTGKVCLDIGASTGGFTDCMLRNGADHVYCIDVGYGQLDWKLRNDPRITNMEKTNVRYLDVDLIGTDVDFISIDVSFIYLKLVLPVAAELLREGGQIVSLVKPQFEAGREQVGKKGIVRDPAVHRQVIEQVIGYAENCGLCPEGLDFSPVTGTKGNIEYLLFMTKKLCNNRVGEDAVRQVVEASHEQL